MHSELEGDFWGGDWERMGLRGWHRYSRMSNYMEISLCAASKYFNSSVGGGELYIFG